MEKYYRKIDENLNETLMMVVDDNDVSLDLEMNIDQKYYYLRQQQLPLPLSHLFATNH